MPTATVMYLRSISELLLRKAGGQDRVDVGGDMREWPCVWRRNYPQLREYRGIPAGKDTILYEG